MSSPVTQVLPIPLPQKPTPAYKKKKIPKAVREALWISFHKGVFEAKCHTDWCPNMINAYNFQAGHNMPESKGGQTSIDNLVPICARCNLSMGNAYTFDEWRTMSKAHPSRNWFLRYFCC